MVQNGSNGELAVRVYKNKEDQTKSNNLVQKGENKLRDFQKGENKLREIYAVSYDSYDKGNIKSRGKNPLFSTKSRNNYIYYNTTTNNTTNNTTYQYRSHIYVTIN